MDPAKIEQMADRDGLRNLMENAKRLERDDIYWLAADARQAGTVTTGRAAV